MCGIAGWFSPAPVEAGAESALQNMAHALQHRGPDGLGVHATGHAAFAHTRLAIIDLKDNVQPMCTADGQIWIVFNGEIYNYVTLRETLLRAGAVFRTRSDTEVILNLYALHGPDGFAQLRGMFAFALWDGVRARGLLVRDPLGIKPLFYHAESEGGLVFASEAKAITAVRPECRVLDECALHLLMNFRYLPDDETLFQNVRQVRPGTILEWTPAGSRSGVPLPAAGVRAGAGPAEVLRDSVHAHLVADVEVGAYLSGGIDSAAVTAFAREQRGAAFRTFTLPFGDDPEEATNAALSANLLDVQNLRGEVGTDIERALRRLVWHLEVPKINAFQTGELARHAARHVKVALSGLGGDELFLGYNLFGWMARAARLHGLLPGRSGALLSGALLGAVRVLHPPPWSEPERAIRVLARLGDWPHVYGLFRNLWDSSGMRSRIYGPRMLDQPLPDAFEYLRGLWPAHDDPVMAAALFERRHKMVNDLLWQEDRCSMAYGLEVRVPFLDRAVLAHVDGVPRTRLMRGGTKKAYLREALAGVLPNEILSRPKSGFQVNASAFFESYLARIADEYLSPGRVRDYGLINPDFVRDLRRLDARARHRWHYFMLYMILMLHFWVDAFEHGRVDD